MADPENVLVLRHPVGRTDVPRLCARLRELARRGPGPVTVDVGAVRCPDLAVVEALARLRLTARRLGRGMRLRNVSGALEALLAWAGLDDALAAEPPAAPADPARSGLEHGGDTEQREQPLGVQEGVEPGDPAP
ncbi:STAS domain-containing protein [Streptomyces sp. NPDC005271]|uniref:STAS domain-containing protein n=1 Tax=unclassified Streptomyces TaxID=2593676 RepID=UPI0033BC739E